MAVQWSRDATSYEQLLGDILHSTIEAYSVFITPIIDIHHPQSPSGTMWHTGVSAVQRIHRDRILGDVKNLRFEHLGLCQQTLERIILMAVHRWLSILWWSELPRVCLLRLNYDAVNLINSGFCKLQ